DARIGALPLERFDQARLFSADVCARPTMNVNLNIESRTENIFPDKIFRTRFFDCAFEDFRAVGEFASYIYIRDVRIERETGNENALEQLMRIFVDDVPILERAGLGLVRVAY